MNSFDLETLKTRAKVERAKREKGNRAARGNFLPFIQTLSSKYQAGWVHRELAGALEWFLEEVQEKRSPRLMVFMPPRHGKSEQVSRYFPAWAFGRNPDLSIIAASYASNLADRMNRDVQRIIDRKSTGDDTRRFSPVRDFSGKTSEQWRRAVICGTRKSLKLSGMMVRIALPALMAASPAWAPTSSTLTIR